MTVPRDQIRVGLSYSGHLSPCPLIRLYQKDRQDGERAVCEDLGYRLGPVLVQQCKCLSAKWNGSLISALCLCRYGSCREECYEVCENMTWMESRRLLCSIFPFLLFFPSFSPLLSCLPPFSDLASLRVIFGNQLGYLGEKVTSRVWWLRNQGQSWWAEMADVDVRQAGGSRAHSLPEGQGNTEDWGCHGSVVLFVAELV